MVDPPNRDEIGRQVTQPELSGLPGARRPSQDIQIKITLSPKCQEECVISRVYAARQSLGQLLLEILAYIFTCGILLILVSWFKEWRYKLFFSIVDMNRAESVVVFGPDGDIQILSLINAKVNAKSPNTNSGSLDNKQSSLMEKPRDEEELPMRKPHQGDLTDAKPASQKPKFRLEKSVFEYRFNKYQFNGSEFIPYGDFPTNSTNAQLVNSHKQGLSEEQIISSRERNGMNKTDIPDKGVIHMTFEELFSPFYLFQVGSTILWLFEGYRIYAYIIIGTSTLSVIFKIYEERINVARLKKFSFFRAQAEVMRDSNKSVISTQDLSYGDRIYLKEHQVAPCDVVVVRGSAIVNEAMLTGESIPIVKTAVSLTNDLFFENKQNVIYCGSQISQISNDLECVVVRIGFETLKGNLIRSIMYPKSHSQISFKNDSGKFILILGSVALISFFVSLSTFLDKVDLGLMETSDVIIRCLDLLTISVPPALPTCLSFGVSFSLKRLRTKKVYCITPEKINICGIVRTICFDKTGTLTEEKLSFKLTAAFESNAFLEQKSAQELTAHPKVIMSSCHSLMLFQGKPAGDPLDAEMFESTGSQLIQEGSMPLLKDNVNGTPVIAEIAVDGNIQNRNPSNVISVLKRFQFEAEVERMSAVVSVDGSIYVVVKGSPEKIRTICSPNSIPSNFNDKLQIYTQEGYRVIALSYKKLESSQPIGDKQERDFFENNLTFAGFLVFENKLKPETTAHIAIQHQNGIQVHMVTGDNPLTSLSVAKQCGILNVKKQIHVLDVVFEDKVPFSTLDGRKTPLKDILGIMNPNRIEFVMGGLFFAQFLEPIKQSPQDVSYLPLFLSSTKVYARMKPDQKQSLIRLLQQFLNPKQGYSFIGMCGDGANDCQALKDADMGISLGEAEASIAASFTSKVTNISIIEFILREGRCCLATSFQCFKFMSLYSIIQCCTTGILYQRGAVPGDFQFLYWDLFIIIPLAFLIGLTDPSTNLTQRTPPHRLFSHPNIISVVGLGIIQFIFLIITVAATASQTDWYISPLDINKFPDMDPSELLSNSFDNAVLFWVSNFQYICSVIAFSLGSEHKKPFFTNIYFTFFLVAIIALSIYSLFETEGDYSDFFEIAAVAYDANEEPVSYMPYWWRWIIAAIIVANMIINILYEKYALPAMINWYEKLHPTSVYQGVYIENKQSVKVACEKETEAQLAQAVSPRD